MMESLFTTETQRHREQPSQVNLFLPSEHFAMRNKTRKTFSVFSWFSLCLCVSVVGFAFAIGKAQAQPLPRPDHIVS